MDLTGLSAFTGSILPGYQAADRQRIADLMAQENYRKAVMERAGQAAAARGLYGGGPPPVSGPVPYAQPMPQPQGTMPLPQGGTAPGGGAGVMPVGASAAPPMGGAPQGSPSGQMGMPGMSVQQLAQVIKARNPGIDDATLFAAVHQANQLLNPESRMLLQYMMNERKAELTERGQDKRLQGTEDTIAGRSDVAGKQIASREGIAANAEAGRNARATTAEAGRNNRAAAKVTTQGPEQEYKTRATELRSLNSQISDLIRENGGMVPEPGSPKRVKYDALVAKKNATLDRMIKVRRDAEQKGAKLPSPSEAVNTPAVPAGLPPATGLADGTSAKDKAGNVVAVVKAGAWTAP